LSLLSTIFESLKARHSRVNNPQLKITLLRHLHVTRNTTNGAPLASFMRNYFPLVDNFYGAGYRSSVEVRVPQMLERQTYLSRIGSS